MKNRSVERSQYWALSAMLPRHRAPGAGTLVAGAMIGTSIGYVASAAREDEVAAAAGVPLVVWVSFATLLAEEIGL